MPRSSKEEVKLSEEKILSKLKRNASLSDYALSKDLGYSRQKIWRIKKQLEQNKTIWGYTTTFNEKKRGFIQCTILIKRSSRLLSEADSDYFLKNGFSELKEKYHLDIESIVSTHGKYDWMITVHAFDIISVRNFITELQTNFNEYISDIIMLESATAIKKQWIFNPELKEDRNILKNLL